MKLIIDANEIFSILIKEGSCAKLFFDKGLDLYSPEYLIIELEKHREEILSKTKRTSQEFNHLLNIIIRRIKILNECYYLSFIDEAKDLSPDPFDVPYFALALKLDCPIWSNDKKLKEQKRVKIYSTYELVKSLCGN